MIWLNVMVAIVLLLVWFWAIYRLVIHPGGPKKPTTHIIINKPPAGDGSQAFVTAQPGGAVQTLGAVQPAGQPASQTLVTRRIFSG